MRKKWHRMREVSNLINQVTRKTSTYKVPFIFTLLILRKASEWRKPSFPYVIFSPSQASDIIMNKELEKSVSNLYKVDCYESFNEGLLGEHKVNTDLSVYAYPNQIALGTFNKKLFIKSGHFKSLINCLENAFNALSLQNDEHGSVIEGQLAYTVKCIDATNFEVAFCSENCQVTISNFADFKKFGNGLREAITTSLIQDFEIELAFKKVIQKSVDDKQCSVLIEALKAWKEQDNYELVFVLAKYVFPVSHPKYDKFTRLLVKWADVHYYLLSYFFRYIKRTDLSK